MSESSNPTKLVVHSDDLFYLVHDVRNKTWGIRPLGWLRERGVPAGGLAYRVDLAGLRLVPVRVEDYTAVNYVVVEAEMSSTGVLPPLTPEAVIRTLNGDDSSPPGLDAPTSGQGAFRRVT